MTESGAPSGIVRPCRPEDLDRVFDIIQDAYMPEKGNTGLGFKKEFRYASKSDFKNDFESAWRVFVFESKEVTSGLGTSPSEVQQDSSQNKRCVMGVIKLDLGEDQDIFFGPFAADTKTQCRGVGKALLAEAHTCAMEQGSKYIRCCMVNWRVDLFAYYGRLQFEPFQIGPFKDKGMTRPSHMVHLRAAVGENSQVRQALSGTKGATGHYTNGKDFMADLAIKFPEEMLRSLQNAASHLIRVSKLHHPDSPSAPFRIAFIGMSPEQVLAVCWMCENTGINLEAFAICSSNHAVLHASKLCFLAQCSADAAFRRVPAFLHASPRVVYGMNDLDAVVAGPLLDNEWDEGLSQEGKKGIVAFGSSNDGAQGNVDPGGQQEQPFQNSSWDSEREWKIQYDRAQAQLFSLAEQRDSLNDGCKIIFKRLYRDGMRSLGLYFDPMDALDDDEASLSDSDSEGFNIVEEFVRESQNFSPGKMQVDVDAAYRNFLRTNALKARQEALTRSNVQVLAIQVNSYKERLPALVKAVLNTISSIGWKLLKDRFHKQQLLDQLTLSIGERLLDTILDQLLDALLDFFAPLPENIIKSIHQAGEQAAEQEQEMHAQLVSAETARCPKKIQERLSALKAAELQAPLPNLQSDSSKHASDSPEASGSDQSPRRQIMFADDMGEHSENLTSSAKVLDDSTIDSGSEARLALPGGRLISAIKGASARASRAVYDVVKGRKIFDTLRMQRDQIVDPETQDQVDEVLTLAERFHTQLEDVLQEQHGMAKGDTHSIANIVRYLEIVCDVIVKLGQMSIDQVIPIVLDYVSELESPIAPEQATLESNSIDHAAKNGRKDSDAKKEWVDYLNSRIEKDKISKSNCLEVNHDMYGSDDSAQEENQFILREELLKSHADFEDVKVLVKKVIEAELAVIQLEHTCAVMARRGWNWKGQMSEKDTLDDTFADRPFSTAGGDLQDNDEASGMPPQIDPFEASMENFAVRVWLKLLVGVKCVISLTSGGEDSAFSKSDGTSTGMHSSASKPLQRGLLAPKQWYSDLVSRVVSSSSAREIVAEDWRMRCVAWQYERLKQEKEVAVASNDQSTCISEGQKGRRCILSSEGKFGEDFVFGHLGANHPDREFASFLRSGGDATAEADSCNADDADWPRSDQPTEIFSKVCRRHQSDLSKACRQLALLQRREKFLRSSLRCHSVASDVEEESVPNEQIGKASLVLRLHLFSPLQQAHA